jgi:hypothetical protein
MSRDDCCAKRRRALWRLPLRWATPIPAISRSSSAENPAFPRANIVSSVNPHTISDSRQKPSVAIAGVAALISDAHRPTEGTRWTVFLRWGSVHLRKNCAFNLHGRLSFRCAIQIIDDHSLKVVGASLRTVADQILDHTAFARDDKCLRNRRRPGFIFGAFQKRRRQPAVVVPNGVISPAFLRNSTTLL